ncbi:LacI family transcriptional regulator [Brachybacterium endophyticum]|uniref:LacI family transcriptional regulator n=1 Tax=Brachybacterium endophyticum TaxID=2182385 RepID=A0A2U2RKA7_9MICO|nr:LacI family DNA-binding transcriptional regulator [Brachybacterium endophyticum]PWH06308.1 LacI family transcriptional regulator [Brachybacterium endophyticum]
MAPRKAPTVYDVASSAGVSIATVSRVLRSPAKVSESTRDRVQRAIDALGYVPNASARGLAGRRTGVLGLLLPGPADPLAAHADHAAGSEVGVIDDTDGSYADPDRNRYFEQLVRGCEISAWSAGYALLIASGQHLARTVVLHDLEGRVDGLVVFAGSVPDDLIARSARRLPLAVVAGRAEGAPDSVRVDDSGGMEALTRHVLAAKPPGPVLYLAGPADSADARDREQGFHAAIADARAAGRDVERHLVPTDGTAEAALAETRRILRETRPAAVIAADDPSALAALAALEEAGISVPDQCVVAGFGGVEEARLSRPTLTTVRQPMTDVGIHAVRTLQRRLADADADPVDLRLPVDLLLRQSCGPA